MLVVFALINTQFNKDKMNRLLLAVLLSALHFSSCTYSDRQNTYSSNRVDQSRNYPIDDRNGFKDLLFGQHFDSVKTIIESNEENDLANLSIREESNNLENKQLLKVSNSYLNTIGDVNIRTIELHFFDNLFYEIRFSISRNDADLMYDTFVEAFGFRPTSVSGWYRMHRRDFWSQTERIDLPARRWRGNIVSAIIIADSTFGDKQFRWDEFRMWNNNLSVQAQNFVDERPNRTASDF